MKIKRFNESEQIKISSSRIEDVLSDLENLISQSENNKKLIEKLNNEFSQYQSMSASKIDEIDNSIFRYQKISSHIDDCINEYKKIINELNNYNKK